MAKVRAKAHNVSTSQRTPKRGQIAGDLSAPDLGTIISVIRKEIPDLSSRKSKQLASAVHAMFIAMNENPCLKTNRIPHVSLQVCEQEKALHEYSKLSSEEKSKTERPHAIELQGFIFNFFVVNADTKKRIILGYTMGK